MTEQHCFYFSIVRLITGRSRLGPRSERSALEAYLAAVIAFTVTYAFLVAPVITQITFASIACAILLVPLMVWILWLALLYLDAKFWDALVCFDIVKNTFPRDFQHVMFCVWLSLFAASLVGFHSLLRWIGVAWFIILALECFATIALRFLNERDAPTS